MSRSCRLFSGLHSITLNTMANIFVIVNSDRSRFGALIDRSRAGDPKVVNTDVDRLETLLEVIGSRSRVVDCLPTAKPSALCGSAPTPVPPPKSDHPKTTAPPSGTHTSYPHMLPKWDKVTEISKAEKVCCACFRAHTWAQGYVPLAHVALVINNNPEGAQWIISAYV